VQSHLNAPVTARSSGQAARREFAGIDPSNRTSRNFNNLHQVYKLCDELFRLDVLGEFDLHL
jgi:hypothetical protein